ncbi:DUF7793 family protein [Draconibacterium halophilum]|uniref:DUF7793 domain-containing protein n=1 Tax=Draconibacterium halophilum TaxID=2706887 RepID=A0A6C0RJP2_9BACT|nr:hypothetical protein [Draconibacterium halophilum]QIA09421.1 hypothetical protein G0Q07_17665 [Draconibacterium halophilum]
MENSEGTEYQVGGDIVRLRKNNIIHVIAKGLQSNELAVEMKKLCLDLNAQMEGKCNYLINVNECGKNEPGAREIWKELGDHDNTHKAAIYGMNPVARLIANFVIGSYSKHNMRFFKSEEEAIDWLLNEKD